MSVDKIITMLLSFFVFVYYRISLLKVQVDTSHYPAQKMDFYYKFYLGQKMMFVFYCKK